jgi:4-carboxymuconolactone decarboxylase
MSDTEPLVQIVHVADIRTLELTRFAIVLAVADEPALREGAARIAGADVPAEWVEELVLQSYLFVGFPRALNAAREWRRASGISGPAHDEGAEHARLGDWIVRGERTCQIVYGAMYGRLRQNIRELHPSLDAWMIAEGYGKVLGRHGLDLARRELCIVATCAVLRQERQLHAHLHGALHAGAAPEAVHAVLTLCGEYLNEEDMNRVRRLWDRVKGGGRT